MPGPAQRSLPLHCLCGCGAPIETCRRRRTKASIPERFDDEGILELQCKKCRWWLVLELFPPIGTKTVTRHGIMSACRSCRSARRRKIWAAKQRRETARFDS